MKCIKEITVDLAGEMLFEYVTAVQGDTNSRFVKVTLLSNAQPYTVPSGATAVIRCRKPDGTSVFNDAAINEDGTITAELTEQMLAAVGNCKCEISLYSSDESCLTSVPFIVKVTAAAVNSSITSADEYTALTSALAHVESASEVATAALEAAGEALEIFDEIAKATEKSILEIPSTTNDINLISVGNTTTNKLNLKKVIISARLLLPAEAGAGLVLRVRTDGGSRYLTYKTGVTAVNGGILYNAVASFDETTGITNTDTSILSYPSNQGTSASTITGLNYKSDAEAAKTPIHDVEIFVLSGNDFVPILTGSSVSIKGVSA